MENKWTNSEAYDLSRFEETNEYAVSRPRLTVRTNKKRVAAAAPGTSPAVVFVFVVLLFTFIGMMIVNSVTAVELGEQIREANLVLSELTEEYNILTNRLESSKNTVAVEEYAKTQLGLAQIADYQVTYVQLEGDDVITSNASAAGSSLKGILSHSMDGVLEYLNLR